MSDNEEQQQNKMDIPPQEAKIEISSTKMAQLQPLWMDDIRGWFALAEIQFQLQNITSEKTKYLNVMASIPAQMYRSTIPDVLTDPPKVNQYAHIKALLLDRLAPSDERQLEALLSGENIGDRRPSEALRHITNLAGTNFSSSIIRSLWTRKMPEIIRIALASQPDTVSLEILAGMADRMDETMKVQHLQINAAQFMHSPRTKTQTRQDRSDYNTPRTSQDVRIRPSQSPSLESRIANIERMLARINMDQQRAPRGRQLSRSNSRSRSRSRSGSRHNARRDIVIPGVCWYHANIRKPRNCTPPCKYAASTSHQNTPKND